MRSVRLGWAALLALVAGIIAAPFAAEAVNQTLSMYYAKGGIAVGSGGTTVEALKCTQVDNQDIGAAAANAVAVKAVTVTGVALTDALISCTPVQDDAAYDDGSLTCFIEATDTVKLVYNADDTGGNPAATNDYVFCWLDFQ